MSRFELYCTILILFLTFIKKRGAKHERKRM